MDGFPTLFQIALPALTQTRSLLGCAERSMVQALFAVMAVLDDTNLLHRGGADGLSFVQAEARRFLDGGGVYSLRWRSRALDLHRHCIARRLSPGGAADTLAATHFIMAMQ
jgi:triphosphoribosyl-dephospho-CoA synthase